MAARGAFEEEEEEEPCLLSLGGAGPEVDPDLSRLSLGRVLPLTPLVSDDMSVESSKCTMCGQKRGGRKEWKEEREREREGSQKGWKGEGRERGGREGKDGEGRNEKQNGK